MINNVTHGLRSFWDEGRGLPYRIASDDWFGGWMAASGPSFSVNANGTEGDDVFTGTDAEDEYHGLAGNDTIDGGTVPTLSTATTATTPSTAATGTTISRAASAVT